MIDGAIPRCTALQVHGSPRGRTGTTRVCGRPVRGYDSAGLPRCGFHARTRTPKAAKPPASGAYQTEPELVVCALSCACGERCEVALPGDLPARQVLAAISCPTCGRRGGLAFCRTERTESL